MMKILRYPLYLLLSGLLVVSLAACDQSSQNIDFSSGENLTLDGPGSATIPNYDSTAYIPAGANPQSTTQSDTARYLVNAFTISQEYTWSVSGPGEGLGTIRDGEIYLADPPEEPGSYTVTVTTTIDGEEYSGAAGTESDYPPITTQASKRSLTILPTVLSAVGLAGPLASDAADDTPNGYTAFAPNDAAFLDVLDDNDDGQISEAELPAPGILAQLLQYHVLPDSLTSTDFTLGEEEPTLQTNESISVNTTTGAVSVNGAATSATVTEADIATNDGVMHQIDGVLAPSALASLTDKEAARSSSQDTVVVDGTYLSTGGFVVLHDSTELANGQVAGSVVGNSSYLEAGFHEQVTIITDQQLDAAAGESVTLGAMAHRDTDGDESYDFQTSGGADDGPYTTSGTPDTSPTPVINYGVISIPSSGN